jgi:hypothetical protein
MLVISCFKCEHFMGFSPWKAVAGPNYRITIRHVKGKTIQKNYFPRSEKGFSPLTEKNIPPSFSPVGPEALPDSTPSIG